MAISASAVYEMRSTATASNANGGGFVTGASGTDFSQQDAAQFNLTGCTSAGADAIILNASAAASMVGNIANVVSGTNATAGRYEIISVVVGVSMTVDRNWGTGAVANGVVNIGGALSEVSDAILEIMVAGNKMHIKNGTYTLGGAISLTAAGSSLKSIELLGYAVTRGDNPVGATRPTIDGGANNTAFAAFWKAKNIIFTGTGTAVVTAGADGHFMDCKFSCTSGTANRVAFTSTSRVIGLKCEFTSTAGYACVGLAGLFLGCYFHDSVDGIRGTSAGNGIRCCGCVFDNCTQGANLTVACTDGQIFQECTFYGAETPAGTGINMAAGNTNVTILNSIVYGFTTGVSHGTAGQTSCQDYSNMFFNNTTNATNWTLDSTTVTGTDPGFSGGAAGNFAVTHATAKAGGQPAVFPGGLSTGAPAIGAVQPNAYSTDPGIANVASGTGYYIAGVSKTGTLVVGAELVTGGFSG